MSWEYGSSGQRGWERGSCHPKKQPYNDDRSQQAGCEVKGANEDFLVQHQTTGLDQTTGLTA